MHLRLVLLGSLSPRRQRMGKVDTPKDITNIPYDSGCTHRSRLFSVLPPSHGQIRDILGLRHCSTHVVPMPEIGRNGRPMTAVDIQINSVDLCFPTFEMK
ncbi:unnamed protein product [Macrosiphum euphorbiae]|uniref:Uncharacterized protein n=1 Tax=Macrosiphum euphorbiae TaxID=13131 RepID=A0AAV0W5N8_9HEMI|nr:unnamed protein product [Macrosiphum euphorbiae]